MTQLTTMNPLTSTSGEDGRYWNELKLAISNTSGFKRWIVDRNIDMPETDPSLDTVIQLYLRQTLETLAY